MVLIRAIIFQTFTNMVWQGTVLGTILGKSEAREETLSGIYGKVMILMEAISSQIVPTWFGKGLSWGLF